MKTTLPALLSLLLIAVPAHAAAWSGQLEDEYHLSGVIDSLSFALVTRSAVFEVATHLTFYEETDEYHYFWAWIDYNVALSEPWERHDHDMSYLADIDAAFKPDEPFEFLYSSSAGGAEHFYYGDYERSYNTGFGVQILYSYDGAGGWSAPGTWVYESILFSENGPRPHVPESGVGALALGLVLLGAAAARRLTSL